MQSNFVYANEVHSECCLVNISSIENLFSVDFVHRFLPLPFSRSTTHHKKQNRTITYNGKKEHYGRNLVKRQRHGTSMLLHYKPRGREYETLPKIMHKHQRGDRKGKVVQPNEKLKCFNTANDNRRRKYEISNCFSSCEAHTFCTLQSTKQEFVNLYRAFNQVKDEVHSFDDKISQYLNGDSGNSKFLALKNLIIAMLFTTEKKFDDMIREYASIKECCSQSNHQERFRKRLCELYRLILICKAHGFIGLSSTSRLELSDQGNDSRGRKEDFQGAAISGCCGEPLDKRLTATKLSEDLEKSLEVLAEINDRICYGVKCIHAQCPSASKSKESHLMCVQLGVNVAERLLRASNKREMMRAFVAWRLDSQLRYNRGKVKKFKSILSQSILYRLLCLKRAQTIKRRLKNWWIFTKLKCKEERVLSSLMIQLAWSRFVHRQYMRMLQRLKIDAAISLQRVSRGFLALRRSDRLKRDIKVAIMLQGIVRISLAKNTLLEKRQERLLYNRISAALTLQKALRRYFAVCKRYLLRAISKAIKIQSQWRCFENRSRFLVVKGAMTIQKCVRRLLSINERGRRKLMVVIRIQGTVRVYAARCARNKRLRESAARKLKFFMSLVLAKRKWRREVEFRAARVVQGCIRRYLSKVLWIRTKLSIKAIQNMARLQRARISLKKLKDEKIQAEFLLKQKRKQLLQMMLMVQFNPSYL